MGGHNSKFAEKHSRIHRFHAGVQKDMAHETNGDITHSAPTGPVLPCGKSFIDSAVSPISNSSSAAPVSTIIIPGYVLRRGAEDGNDGQSCPPAVDQQRFNTTSTPSTVPSVESIESTGQNSGHAISQDEEDGKLPTTVALANLVLDTAAEKLKKKLPAETWGITSCDIKPSADISSLAENIGTTLVTLMDKRNVEKSKQTRGQGMVIEWAKKTIPFVETGLTIANVPIPHSRCK